MKTKSGYKWTKLKSGFRDDQTGLVWLAKESCIHTHEQSLTLQDKTKRLPTIGELRLAWEHEACEVMTDFKDHTYWSSSVHPDVSSYAYGLDGHNGYFYNYYRYHNVSSVRCVRSR